MSDEFQKEVFGCIENDPSMVQVMVSLLAEIPAATRASTGDLKFPNGSSTSGEHTGKFSL